MIGHTFCRLCRREVDASWSFCAHCGTDNRPPTMQWPVLDHPCLFPTASHCVFCGGTRPVVDELGVPTSRTWLIVRTVGFGLLALSVCAVSFYGAFRGIIQGQTWSIVPWHVVIAEGAWARIFGAVWLAIGCISAISFIRRYRDDFGT
jgi:hypothetical protein